MVLGLRVALTMMTLFLLRKSIPSAYCPSLIASNWNPLSVSSTTQLSCLPADITQSLLTSLLRCRSCLTHEVLGAMSDLSLRSQSFILSSATNLAWDAHPFHEPNSLVLIGYSSSSTFSTSSGVIVNCIARAIASGASWPSSSTICSKWLSQLSVDLLQLIHLS